MKISQLTRLLLLSPLIILLSACEQGISTCRTNDYGVSYCKYEGKIKQLYVNSQDTIIVYLYNPVEPGIAKSFDFDVENTSVAAHQASDRNQVFSDYLYTLLLEAKINNKPVTLHFRHVENQRFIIDRAWLN